MEKDQKKLVILLGSIIVILLVLIVIFVIVLKNKQGKQDNNTDNKNTQNIELVYWGLWEPEGVMKSIIEKYEEQNAGVKILYSQQTFRNYESRVYTRLQQSTGSNEPSPDILRINNTWLPKFQQYLSPLPSSVMDTQKYSELFYPTVVNDFTGKDGKIYAIPWEIDGLMVIYNKQLLAEQGYSEPPKDWDSFIEAAYKLTKRNSSGRITQSGLAIGTSRNISHSADILSFMMLQNGANLINDSKTETNLTSERSVSALTTYTSFATGETPLWASYLANDLSTFFKGELAMMFAPSWRAFDILEAAPQIEFGLAQLPQLPNNDPVYYSMYWGDTVSSTTQHPLEAWKFVKYLSEPEQQRELFANSSKVRAFGEPYSLVNLNSDLLSNPYTKAIAEMAPYMKSWQMGDQSFVEELLRNAITEVVENNREPASILSNTQKDINNQLAVSNK